MKFCQPVTNLKLDKFSLDAIERINRKSNLGNLLGSVMSVGVISSIFTKSSAPFAAYNITQTDWDTYALAMKSIPSMIEEIMEKEIELMIMHYELYYDHQHLLFWKGMYSGCK